MAGGVGHVLGVAYPISGDGYPETLGRLSGARGPGDGLRTSPFVNSVYVDEE